MTLHTASEWYSNYKCSLCGAKYIPFSKNIKCPACGLNENLANDFIDKAAKALWSNYQERKSYVPRAYWVGYFSDEIILKLCRLFEEHRKRSSKDFSIFSKKWVNTHIDEMYLKKHFLDIALAVKKCLNRLSKCPSPDIFQKYTSGKIKGDEKKRIDRHHKKCIYCQNRLRVFYDIDELFS